MTPERTSSPHLLWLPLSASLIFLAGASAQAASYPATVLADNPVAYYRLEQTNAAEAVLDSSATGAYVGWYACDQFDGCFPAVGQPGIDTNSVLFHPQTIDGTAHHAYATIPFSPDLNPAGAFSVEAWVRAIGASPTAYRAAVSSYNHNNGNEGWFFYQTPAPGGSGSSWVWVQKFGGIWISGGPVAMFQWQHLAASSDGSYVSFYVNGQFMGKADVSTAPPNSASELLIGTLNQTGGFFDGNVDEVAIYARALTATQILTHYQVGVTNFRAGALPPSITANPQPVTAYAGHTVKFSVSSDGTKPLSYQWYKGSAAIAGATDDTLTFACAFADNGSAYKAVVTNLYGLQESSAAALTVLTNLALSAQPTSSTRTVGSKAAFRVAAEGAWPISFQWFKNNNPIPGATNETLWLSKLQLADDASTFTARVRNPYGSLDSDPATLTVVPRASTVELSRYGKVVAADDPVAYWRLDQPEAGSPALDAIGSFDGVYEDASSGGTGVFGFGVPSGIPHETNSAVSVSGGAWVKVPYALELNPYGPFTLEAWVKPASLSANDSDYRSLLGSLGNGVGGPIGWHIYQIPTHQWLIAVWGDNWINTWLYDAEDTIVANQWYHMVVAYDGAFFKMYVNGVLRINDTWSGFIQNRNGALVLGWRTDKDWKPFDGTIDDVAVYNKELTSNQVQGHYAASVRLSIAKQGDKVVLSWPFGTLQQAATANGLYSDLTTASSPFTNSLSGGPKYYRVKAY